MKNIQVTIRGYTIYCENDQHEIYDFFVPKQSYKMNKSEALDYIPETHKLLDIKRDSEVIFVKYEELLKIKL